MLLYIIFCLVFILIMNKYSLVLRCRIFLIILLFLISKLYIISILNNSFIQLFDLFIVLIHKRDFLLSDIGNLLI